MQKRIAVFLIMLSCNGAMPPCPKGINLLPMYGRTKKCAEQIESDKQFLLECAQKFKNSQEAAKDYTAHGWEYFYNGQLDFAMKRFNQAWLLDSMNEQVPWGFANILGKQGHFKESLPFFRLAIKRNPTNAAVLESASTSYGQVFFTTKDIAMLDTTIRYLKKSIRLNPKNVRAYSQLTGAYCYYTQKDSARKYLAITEALDPQVIDSEVRRIIVNSH